MSIYQFFLCIHRYRQKDIVTVTSTCHSLQAAKRHGKRGNRGKPGEKRPGPATFEDHGQEELIMQMQQSRSQAEGWTNRQTRGGTRNPSKQTNKSLLSAVTRVVCVTFSARWRCPNKKWKKKTVFTGHEYIKQHTSTFGGLQVQPAMPANWIGVKAELPLIIFGLDYFMPSESAKSQFHIG